MVTDRSVLNGGRLCRSAAGCDWAEAVTERPNPPQFTERKLDAKSWT